MSSSVMEPQLDGDVDAVEEIRLRVWARKNYAPIDERDETWHPVILEEMSRKDREMVRHAD